MSLLSIHNEPVKIDPLPLNFPELMDKSVGVVILLLRY